MLHTFKITPSADAKPLPCELEDRLIEDMDTAIYTTSDSVPQPWDAWFKMNEDGTISVCGYTGPNCPELNGEVTIEFKPSYCATAVEKFNSCFEIKTYPWDHTTPEDAAEIKAELEKYGWELTEI